jgi:hypothetical protein
VEEAVVQQVSPTLANLFSRVRVLSWRLQLSDRSGAAKVSFLTGQPARFDRKRQGSARDWLAALALNVVMRLSRHAVNVLDDRQRLGCERQDIPAAIPWIRHTHDKTGRLQLVKHTKERNRPDVENLSKTGATNSFRLREVGEDYTLVVTDLQLSCLVQKPHNYIRLLIVGIFVLCRGPSGCGLF